MMIPCLLVTVVTRGFGSRDGLAPAMGGAVTRTAIDAAAMVPDQPGSLSSDSDELSR